MTALTLLRWLRRNDSTLSVRWKDGTWRVRIFDERNGDSAVFFGQTIGCALHQAMGWYEREAEEVPFHSLPVSVRARIRSAKPVGWRP